MLPTLNAQAFTVFIDGRLVADLYDKQDGLQEDGVVLTTKLKIARQGQKLKVLSTSLGVPNFAYADWYVCLCFNAIVC